MTQYEAEEVAKPEAPVAAAIIAAGMGAFAIGLFTTLAEISASFKDFLNFYDPVGPLSGKTTYAVVVWLVSWTVLHLALRRSTIKLTTGLVIGAIFLTLGVLGTFPPFFEAFAAE